MLEKARIKGALKTLGAVFGGFFLTISHAVTDTEYQQSINKVAKEISAISKNLNANKSLLKTEREQLFAIEQDLLEQNKTLKNVDDELERQQRDINQLEQQLSKVLVDLKSTKQALTNQLLANYKSGHASYLKTVLNQKNPYALGRLNNYQRYFSNELSATFVKINDQLKTVDQLQQQQQNSINELKQKQAQQQQKVQELLNTQQQRKKLIARLDNKVSTSTEKLKRLTQNRERLEALLKQVRLKAAQLRRAEQERLRQANNEPLDRPKRALVKGGFLQQKGRLSYPVTQQHQIGFGARIPESGLRSEGLFYDTGQSVDVKSIFRGRVLFADVLKGYGLLLIIDHGDDHISLYGHNKVIFKKVGESVSSNEVISKTGVTGGLKNPGLYFEIRNNATPINPAQWCQ